MRNQGVHQSEVISTAGKIKTAVASMVSCLWEADDILEIRLLRPDENATKQSWHTADELPDAAASKAVINLAGWNVYCGANPRERMGAAGDRNVPIARSLFVDFDDGIDLPEAKARWGEAVIPEPTLVIDSGHGVHAYWRLRTAFINLDDWTRSQKRLIGLLNSDKVVHNPERIMRLPGTMNVKGTPHVPCKILRADPTRTYDLTSLLPPETDGTSGPFRTNDWKSALDALGSLSPSRADDYDDWLAVGQCLHSVDQSGSMLSEWDRWSRQSGKHKEGDCDHRWSSFGPERGRTVATLIHMAKQDSGANERTMSSNGKAATSPPLSALEGRTDIANGRRFAQIHGENVRYSHPWKHWLIWDGCRWKIDDTGAVNRLAKDVADRIWTEARRSNEKHSLAFAAKTAGDKHVKAMLNQAKSEPGIHVLPAQMDQHPWLLNCPNGTIDLQTGVLRPHDRTDMLTRLCPTQFDSDAQSYQFDRFLESILITPDLTGLVQRWFGLCLTASVREHVLPIFHGNGANGKTTLLNLFCETVGFDYTMQAKPDMLMSTRNESHATERMDLFGKRFVVCAESQEGRRLNEPWIKTLVGGDPIRGRRCYENPWQFDPTHKVVLCTNHKPKIKGTDHAIWRRIRLVPFNMRFWDPDNRETGPPKLKQDKELSGRLNQEREGVLAWAVRGCLDWQKGGLDWAGEVLEATANYRTEEDAIGRFLDERCILNPGLELPFGRLYSALETWAKDAGDDVPTRTAVGKYLQNETACRRVDTRPLKYSGVILK